MTVFFEDEAGIAFEFDMQKQLEQVIACVCKYVNCPFDVEVSVTMVDKQAIKEMNEEFRDIDRSTDVLSFPMMEYDVPADFEGPAFEQSKTISPDHGELVLGDIVLCAPVIKEQAVEYGHSELREFSFLVVHSMLHLFGYDHMVDEEREQMEERQREVMDILGIHREK